MLGSGGGMGAAGNGEVRSVDPCLMVPTGKSTISLMFVSDQTAVGPSHGCLLVYCDKSAVLLEF